MKIFSKLILAFFALSLLSGIYAAPDKSAPSPRYGQITATLAELQTLADAMTLVYIDIGCYVTIENLNDLLSSSVVHDFDNINQYTGTWIIDQSTALFRPDRVNLTVPPRLWLGPYVTYQDSRVSIEGAGYDRGSLLDYWGEPYYLFSPAGLVRGDQHIVTLELYGDYFDSYAIVSLGPDGVKSSDDLIRTFGMPPSQLLITSLSAQSAHPGDTLRVRGYNFGSQGSKQTAALYLNNILINTVTTWTDRQIEFIVPAVAQSGGVKIVSGSTESNAIPLTITEHPTSASNWILYE